jgi:hypothetical protein
VCLRIVGGALLDIYLDDFLYMKPVPQSILTMNSGPSIVSTPLKVIISRIIRWSVFVRVYPFFECNPVVVTALPTAITFSVTDVLYQLPILDNPYLHLSAILWNIEQVLQKENRRLDLPWLSLLIPRNSQVILRRNLSIPTVTQAKLNVLVAYITVRKQNMSRTPLSSRILLVERLDHVIRLLTEPSLTYTSLTHINSSRKKSIPQSSGSHTRISVILNVMG